MLMGCVWCIERSAPAFCDQTIPHTSPIYIKGVSTIYIVRSSFSTQYGAKNFVPLIKSMSHHDSCLHVTLYRSRI